MIRRVLMTATLGLFLSGLAAAQSAQRFSIQGSGAVVFPTAEETAFTNATRLGWEAQLRYTFSRLSLGAGYQQSTVYKLESGDFSGAVHSFFLEPRYVVTAGSRVAVYLAGRLGMSQLVCSPEEDCAEQSWEAAYGGGGGLLFLLGTRVSIDLGSQYFATRYTTATGSALNTGYILARLGLSIGL